MNFRAETSAVVEAVRRSETMKIARTFVLILLRGYKWVLSPMLPPSCRYVPTCSEYAMEAVERYGTLRGGWMAAMRVLRCHPFVKGGYDPVLREARLRSLGGLEKGHLKTQRTQRRAAEIAEQSSL